jgi:hypothetical protein
MLRKDTLSNMTTPPSTILTFEYGGSSMIGWNTNGSNPSYNFLTTPGGTALAGSFNSGSTTTTWVPLIDASGSTIALVNAASPQSGPATTYTYDPSGNPTVTGTANDWPFQYNGMEKEFTDGLYYYTGSGQYYSPELTRSLSEVGETSTSGPGGGPAGNAIALPSGGGNGSFGQWVAGQFNPFGQPNLGGLPDVTVTLEGAQYVVPVGAIAQAIEELVSFFDWLLGGSDTPPIPRQLRHNRHPLYPVILGIQDGLIPDEMPAGPEETCGDLRICNIRPLAGNVLEIPQATTPATPTPQYVSSEEAITIASYLIEHNVPRAEIYSDLIAAHVEPHEAADLAFGPNPGTPIPNPLETPEP